MNKEFDLSKYKTEDGILSELPDGWREIAAVIFAEGGDIKNVMVALGLSKKNHERYMSEQDYFDAMDNGMVLSESYWLHYAKANMNEKTFNTALFNSMMNRMFKWDSKTDTIKKQKVEEEKKDAVSKYLDKYDKTQNKNKRLDA